jgi:hypothetical protein
MRSSVEARPAIRAAGNSVLVLLALCLALLSREMGSRDEARQQRLATHSAAAVRAQSAAEPRRLFVPESSSRESRRHHRTFQTSSSAGALGFWILISLLALLLGGAGAPVLIQRLRKHA